MPKKNLISEEERALFKTAVADVAPLAPHNKIPAHKKPKLLRRKISSQNSIDIVLDIQNSNSAMDIEPVNANTFLKFTRPGLQTRVIQKLRRGEFTIEAVLDLHGLNLVEAQKMLAHFLAHALKKHWRCIQIIHGKNTRSEQMPVLKNSVNQWLRNYTAVLAFCSSKASDGGTGAVYVLLKNV